LHEFVSIKRLAAYGTTALPAELSYTELLLSLFYSTKIVLGPAKDDDDGRGCESEDAVSVTAFRRRGKSNISTV
jgi:hypothetical protein